MNLKPLIRFTIFLLRWVVIPFVFIEIAMILADRHLGDSLFVYDPDMGYRVRPNEWGSNSLGFNDREYPLARIPGIPRIMVVSDSYNWMGGQTGNYTHLLEERFAAETGMPKVEVLNVGYPGTHTGDQLAMLKKFGLPFQPDLVVLGFFAGNDFVDADPLKRRISVNGMLMEIDKRREIRLFGLTIVPESRLWLFLQQKWKANQSMQKKAVKRDVDSASKSDEGTMTEEVFDAVESARMDICNLDGYAQGRYGDRIAYAMQNILEMKRLLQERGIDFKVAIYPDEFQVSKALADHLFEKHRLDRGRYDLDLMQKILVDFLKKNGIDHLDMLDRFRKEGENRRLYELRDTHWNLEGNRLASELLYDWLSPVYGSK